MLTKPFHRAMSALVVIGLLTGVVAGHVGASRFPDLSTQSSGTSTLSPYWSRRILRWETLILQEANRRGLDPDLIASLVWMESRGEADAVGPVGSVGLMQVMPKEEGFSWRPSKEALLDPSLNLFWGTRTLSIIIQQGNGDIFNALAAYNAGWEKIDSRQPRYFATTILRDYANAVAMRCGITGRWVAFFAVKSYQIRGPIWIADSARQDVYFFGQTNVVPEGTALIPNVAPAAVVARFEAEDTGAHHEVGLWLYSAAQNVWNSCVATSGAATPMPTFTATPTAMTASVPLVAPTSTLLPIPSATPTGVPPTTPTSVPVLPSPTPTFALFPTATPGAGETADAVVLENGADLRPGATRWWDPVATLLPGTPVRLLGYDPDRPEWVYLSTLDKTLLGWTQIVNLKVLRPLKDLPLVTPLPTLTPTTTATPTPTATPTVACTGESLWAEAWPIRKLNTVDGWMAVIYVRGHGGNCVYTYAWNEEENVVGGPTLEGHLFEVRSPDRAGNIVGTVLVMSGDEMVRVGVYIKPPDSGE
ncbi:MAG TPA: transglycosylase SLT domain-containing protein [Anaerolineae bacterium]|nr:transglycosylase SLT domain-containing protein [Anaerolineae bacterium]